jgi:ligand-binding sensor domain-containing protein
MNNKLKLIYLILILALNFSCVENKSTKNEVSKSELASNSKADTLKFTSGISDIFQDSKGNIWFGDRDAGVWKYDGETMKNYTKKDGLTNDFALSIYEDNNGKLWFGMADGNVYQFNGNTFEKQF